MDKRNTRLYLRRGFYLIIPILIISMICLPGGLELKITPQKGGKPLLILPIKVGEGFTLHYIHSVNRCPIWEEHLVDNNGNILIKEERFLAFSAGMGHWPGHGTLTSRGKYQVIEDINKSLGGFVLRVAEEENNHIIIWRGIKVNLSKIVAGQAVFVGVDSISVLKYFWRCLFPHPTTPAQARES